MLTKNVLYIVVRYPLDLHVWNSTCSLQTGQWLNTFNPPLKKFCTLSLKFWPLKTVQLCIRWYLCASIDALMVLGFPEAMKNGRFFLLKDNSPFPPFLHSFHHQLVCCTSMLLLWYWASLLTLVPPACITQAGWTSLLLPATRSRFLVDWLFKPPLTFPEIEERGKRGKQRGPNRQEK